MKQNGFWQQYKRLIKDVVLDYQYLVMLDEKDITIEREREDMSLPHERSQAITNFKIAAGMEEGEHYGWWFQDTDVYKWIEAAAYTLENYSDDKLRKRVDDVIDIIEAAQEKDGYLSTFYQLKVPHLKYKELDRSHELYNAGHLIEAAVAYYKATQDNKLLKIADRFVDNIIDNFGPGKIEGADGHQEIELALIKFYELTQNEKYLKLSRYFIDVRGENIDFYNQQKEAQGEAPKTNLDYLQAYTKPILQKEARGHAVRMLYMLEAMADLAYYQKDDAMKEAVETLWSDITQSKMYVTGGVGQTVQGEAFAAAYELPNDTMYCETCAAIGMANSAKRLFKLRQDDEIIDVMERSLYNGMLAGMSQDGQHFFYVNPLEFIKDRYSPDKGHVKGQRPEWLGCACCPPNLSRTIASIDSYFYSRVDDEIYIHMLGDSHYHDDNVNINQTSSFPKHMNNHLDIEIKDKAVNIHIRKPDWANKLTILINGEVMDNPLTLDIGHHAIDIKLDYQPFALYTNSNVVHNANKVAFQYGPLVYCGESIDQKDAIYKYKLNPESIALNWQSDTLGSRYNLVVDAKRSITQNALYLRKKEAQASHEKVNLIPYYLWANRGITDMMVWLFEDL